MAHVSVKFNQDITINGRKFVAGVFHLVPAGVADAFSRCVEARGSDPVPLPVQAELELQSLHDVVEAHAAVVHSPVKKVFASIKKAVK